jgi:hypothetical protein
MSTIMIRNLSHSTELDRKAMSTVRGGTALGSPNINVYVPINLSQTNNMAQTTNVLNNSVVGYGADLSGLTVNPSQWGMNVAMLPTAPTHYA